MSENIKTAVDLLIELLKKKKKITLDEASKELGIPANIINEWATFLEEEKILKIEYRFTTPYLIFNEDVNNKTKKSNLDMIERKLSTMLAFVKRQEIKHKLKIKDIAGIKSVLKNSKDKCELSYAQKKYLEFELTKLLGDIKNIKDKDKFKDGVKDVLKRFDSFKKCL
ncbi:MAG: hypothetical protein KJ674_01215 [Nanoarchaeota archaeon]|nr:hypothetical protein [Nanoarchaeota archaeon]